MLDGSLVVLVDGLHQEFDQYGRFVTEFLEINVGMVARQSSLNGRKKILHFDAEFLRLGGILHIIGIKRSVLTNHAHIGFRLKVTHGSLDTQRSEEHTSELQ